MWSVGFAVAHSDGQTFLSEYFALMETEQQKKTGRWHYTKKPLFTS